MRAFVVGHPIQCRQDSFMSQESMFKLRSDALPIIEMLLLLNGTLSRLNSLLALPDVYGLWSNAVHTSSYLYSYGGLIMLISS